MHVHVADLDAALVKFLKNVTVDAPDWTYANCTGGKLKLNCTWAAPGSTAVSARCFSVNKDRGPSDIAPFQTVYGVSGRGPGPRHVQD